MSDRGLITNRPRAEQILDFRGLRYGLITPTNIDGVIDFGDKAFPFFEIKLEGTQLKSGQRLALARLVDSVSESGRESLGLVAEHRVFDPAQDVDAATCIVIEFRYKHQWRHVKDRIVTLREAIDGFLTKHGLNYDQLPGKELIGTSAPVGSEAQCTFGKPIPTITKKKHAHPEAQTLLPGIHDPPSSAAKPPLPGLASEEGPNEHEQP
jgi:hypothetical protein